MKNNPETRYMGIDYGSVRIGLALSDPLKIIAQGFSTIPNDDHSCEEIVKVVQVQHVKRIIVGNPLNLKGEVGSKAEEVKSFVHKLRERSTVEIILVDERFTSVIAQKSFIAMGSKKKQRQNNKGKIDEMAAAILLQGYLDSQPRY